MRSWYRLALPVLAVLLGIASAASAQQPKAVQSGPSFACTSGQGIIETTICGSPALSAADRELATLYAANRVSAFGRGPSNLLVSQRATLKQMQACAKPTGKMTVAACLQDIYSGRSFELAIAALVRSPDLALPVIRRFDPTFAPILEAIGIWASEPENANWSAPALAGKRTRILTLLKPSLNDLLTNKDEEFFRSSFNDATPRGQTVRRVEDLLATPGNLAAFLNVLGPSPIVTNGNGGFGRAIPCAAIVGHPTLLNATASLFGATPDSFVFNSDCEETLPPTPALTALDGKLRKGWPACEGTIRFAAYRQYATSVDSARLGIVHHDPEAGFPARHGVAPADVAAARGELAAYYAQYLGKAPAKAAQMAADAVSAVMTAGQECE